MNNLGVIIASTRPQRIGGSPGTWVSETLASQWDITVLDLAEINLPFVDEELPAGSGVYTKPHTLAWKDAIDAVDALVIVTPEYNGFFPAPLKNAIDFLKAEWEGKPVALVGYGWGGGKRALTALTQLLENVKANVVGSTGLVFNSDISLTGELSIGDAKVSELLALSDNLDEAVTKDGQAA